jgi:hypothetical protein
MSGFTLQTWREAATFRGRVATEADVENGPAVFALSDTHDALAFEEPLPQPAIWYDDEAEEEFAVLIVQAEQHTTEDGQDLQVLGLLLPDGRTAVAFTDDVTEVAADDADWIDLIDAELAPDPDEPDTGGPDIDEEDA